MKGFSFRLQAVLTLRESEEEKALEAYAQAMKKRRATEHACEQQTRRIQDLQNRLDALREGRFPATNQQNFFQSLCDAQTHLNKQLELLAKDKEAEQKKLHELLIAKSKVDILERLKEKRRDTFEREMIRQQEKEVDDLIGARFRPAV